MTRKPTSFKLDAKPDPAPKQKPVKKPRKPRAMPAPEIIIEEDIPEQPIATSLPEEAAIEKTFRWGGLFLSASISLFTLWLSVTFMRLIDELFARSPMLGWAGFALLSIAGIAAAALFLRETFGLMRLRKLSTLRDLASKARNENDEKTAASVIRSLKKLYANRPDTQWGLAALKEHDKDIIDAADRIDLAERDLLVPLDEQAGRIIAASSRRVTVLTAITPAAMLDVLFVAAQNLMMLRRLATLYGGRPGTFGTMKLGRMVISHLAITGGLALTDGLVQSIIGKGLMGRLSSRLGEGTVNGILTTRIGLAALDLTRPIPFRDMTRPSLAEQLKNVISFDDGKND